MTLLDSSFSAANGSMILIAPSGGDVPRCFRRIEESGTRYESLLAEMQRLRGAVYLGDGAIAPWEIDEEGRHQLDIDSGSWQVLSRDSSGAVRGCARLRMLGSAATFSDLWIRHAALAGLRSWGQYVRAAVESEMALARRRSIAYAEVGGWAIAEERRGTGDAVRIALAAFGLAQALGGCIGITTATMRHSSSSILRRLGGTPLAHYGIRLPPYYDPQFKCDMEMLRFDSSRPTPRYQGWVEQMRFSLLNARVICKGSRHAGHGLVAVTAGEQASRTIPGWAVFQPA
jgi:hypothetical protein